MCSHVTLVYMAEKSIVEHFQSSCVLVEKCLRNLDSRSYESMIGDAMGWRWQSIFKRIKSATPGRMELGVVAQRKRPTSGLEEKPPFASTEALLCVFTRRRNLGITGLEYESMNVHINSLK